jgi:peptidoglycan/LPS O-acetylase OafA/YrhL
MVAQSFDRSRSILDFAVARILRIFPALIVCVLITSFMIAPMVGRLSVADYLASPGLYAYLAKTLSLSTGSASLPGVFETVPYSGYVNSSLWTLKYEVICYVGLGVLGLAGLFQPRWRIAALTGLALMVATVSLSLPSNPEAFVFLDNDPRQKRNRGHDGKGEQRQPQRRQRRDQPKQRLLYRARGDVNPE